MDTYIAGTIDIATGPMSADAAGPMSLSGEDASSLWE